MVHRSVFVLIGCLILSSCAMMGNSVVKKEIAVEYMELADAYAAVKKYDKAATFYERAAKHDEYYNATRYKLARMYALSGKWENAVEVLEELYLQEPDNLLISNAYSYALVSLGELEKALPIYEKNYAEHDDNPVQARNYAEILFLAQRWDDATACIELLREQFGDTEELSDLDNLEKRIAAAIEREKKEAEQEGVGEDVEIDETEKTRKPGKTDDSGESAETNATSEDVETAESAESDESGDNDVTGEDGETVQADE